MNIKKRLDKLINEHEQEKQKLEKELEESKEYISNNEKNKAKLIKKNYELNKEKQEYIEKEQKKKKN